MIHRIKLILFILIGVFLFNTSALFLDDANASTGSRTYYRHDCSSSDNTSYISYSLEFGANFSSNELNRTIIGNNDMVRDYNTAVVRLSNNATGFIIGEHTIVTAAHCVYNWNRTHYFYDDITIDIVDANNNVLDTLSPTYFHIPEDFAMLCYVYDYQNDYALITVEEDLSDYGMFNLAVAQSSYISNQGQVVVSGFPAISDYPSGYYGSNYGIRFKASGNLTNSGTSNGHNIYYTADMVPGDSGGPVYVEEGGFISGTMYEYKSVIGINVAQFTTYNIGVQITDDLLRFYYDNDYII